jgi:hypothetical protein
MRRRIHVFFLRCSHMRRRIHAASPLLSYEEEDTCSFSAALI